MIIYVVGKFSFNFFIFRMLKIVVIRLHKFDADADADTGVGGSLKRDAFKERKVVGFRGDQSFGTKERFWDFGGE